MLDLRTNDCCKYMAGRDLMESGGRRRSSRRVKAERAIIKHTLQGLDAGKTGLRLKASVLRRAQVEVGLDPTMWIMIISLLVNVMRLATEWWKRRAV